MGEKHVDTAQGCVNVLGGRTKRRVVAISGEMSGDDDDLARTLLRQIIHVVYHRDEEVEEQLPTVLHFVLHRAAALEGVSSSDDEREIVCSQFRVVVGCIGVCEARRR